MWRANRGRSGKDTSVTVRNVTVAPWDIFAYFRLDEVGSCPNWGSFAHRETVFGTSAAVSIWDEAKGWTADSVGADEAENATPLCQDDS